MNTFFRSTLALLALTLVGSVPLAAQQASMAYVNSDRIRQEVPIFQQARQQMQQQMPALEARADSAIRPLQAELQQMLMDLQEQQSAPVSQQAREQQQAEVLQKQQALQQEGQQWEQRAAELQNQILGPPLQQFNQVINSLREERGYAIVLDLAAGGILTADPSLDITDEVIRRLTEQGS